MSTYLTSEEIDQAIAKFEAELKQIEKLEIEVREKIAKHNYQPSAEERERAKALLPEEERALIENLEKEEQLKASQKAVSSAHKIRMRRGLRV